MTARCQAARIIYMKLNTLLKRIAVPAVMALSLASPSLHAAYPDKPITVVVPYAPGGATDSTARIMAQALQDIADTSFVVENVPGAGTTIGAGRVARAQADGYTLLFGGLSANVLAPQVYRDIIDIDPDTAFEPVGGVASQPFILVVNTESRFQNLGELLEEAHDNPGALNFGSPGQGSAPHLISELFLTEADIEATHIPFKGAAPAMTALIGGNIDFFLDTPTTPMPQVKGDRLRALGISTLEEAEGLEGIPTFDSQGVDGYEASTWFAFYAPKGTDAETLDKINVWINEALARPEVQKQFTQAYLYPMSGDRQALSDFTQSERSRWSTIVDSLDLSDN